MPAGGLRVRRHPSFTAEQVAYVADPNTVYSFTEIRNGWAKWAVEEEYRIKANNMVIKPFDIMTEGWTTLTGTAVERSEGTAVERSEGWTARPNGNILLERVKV